MDKIYRAGADMQQGKMGVGVFVPLYNVDIL